MGGIGNSNFGFSAGGSSSGGTIVGGGTLNYICKYTPNGISIGNSLLYDNGISVGLGTVIPDASAILELSSTTQGFATPRMTTLQRDAIVTPVIGLLIYNTSSSFFNYWDGVAWIQMDTSTGGDVSGSGTTNYAVKWTDGTNSVIGDGTWAFSGNDYYPVTTGSNIGDATHRIGTIFMASVFDYANDLTFFNGTSTTMTLTTGGQLGIGTTPSAMMDIKPSGSGTVGVNINTSSVQDAILTFGINNNTYGGLGYRAKIYVTSIGQETLNFYTLNNDTVFWNGIGAVQSKTLTLFTDTTAKFENNLGVGVTAVSNTRLHVKGVDATSSNYAFKVDDLVLSALFYVRNDGVSIFGSNVTIDGKDVTNYPISIRSARLDLTRIQNLNLGNTQTDIQIGNNNGANSIYYGVNTAGNSFIDNRTGNLLFQNTGVTQMTFDNTGKFGIGVSPLAQLHAKGIDATTKVNLRLEPVANVTEDTGGKTLNTTTNATVPLETIEIPTDTVIMVESYVTCRKTGGVGVGTIGDGNGYVRTVKAKNVGGVVTIGVVQSSFTSEDIAPLNTTFAVSGTNIVLNITGATNDDITWNSITKKYKVA